MITEKRCTGPCRLVKPISQFSIRKDSPSGYRGRCKVCLSRQRKQHYQDNTAMIRERGSKYRENNADIIRLRKAKYYQENKENICSRVARNRLKNPDYAFNYRKKNVDNIKSTAIIWRLKNPDYSAKSNAKRRKNDPGCDIRYRFANAGMIKAACARYRAAKLERTVAWANLDKIREVYNDCEEVNLAARTAGCPSNEKFVVDHEIPLQGKLVSGLHVEANLQIITALENSSKGNKFTPG